MNDEKMTRTALVVIDLQTGSRFLARHIFKQLTSDQFKQVLLNNRKLVTQFSAQNLPIIIVTLHPKLLPKILDNRFTQPLVTADLAYQLQKPGPSAFKHTELSTYLQQQNIKQLLVTGFTTDNGVKKTVQDAEKLGFMPIVVTDATVARNSEKQQEMLKKFKHTCSTAEVLKTFKNEQKRS
ncbi:isochorismatase family protein [Pediococcus ethanolidurans]|uniref:cysteine hydrolase n=1 Tax=Pediococcus ethanolidurans TaxID=319653 RepID=UPI002952BB56|nr:cysteine hydrolase [Pediococcus ethanolidurans]MDV7718541.1 isochorismatase family protein [Pediococcus ethanolidurans]